jgi:hypothetical protein
MSPAEQEPMIGLILLIASGKPEKARDRLFVGRFLWERFPTATAL